MCQHEILSHAEITRASWKGLFDGVVDLKKLCYFVVDNFFIRNHLVGVLDRGVLNRPVNLFCVLPILDGDAKRHKVYTGSGNRCPTSSLRERSCIPCTEVLVVGAYKLGERGS